jgi:hypothetical protein
MNASMGEIFFDLADARPRLGRWRRDYNEHCPHSSLDDRTPVEFATTVGQRGLPLLLSVPKAGPQPCQDGSATSGQKPPAFDRDAVPPSESKMRAKPLPRTPAFACEGKVMYFNAQRARIPDLETTPTAGSQFILCLKMRPGSPRLGLNLSPVSECREGQVG